MKSPRRRPFAAALPGSPHSGCAWAVQFCGPTGRSDRRGGRHPLDVRPAEE
jgi:hypothetical protein